MKLTKYQHACAVIELDGQAVVIDPGVFSDDFVMHDSIVAIVLTHQHPDHASANLIGDIVRRYPDVAIFATSDHHLDFNHQTVGPGDTHTVGVFELSFFGGQHALIDQSIPLIENIGVAINNRLFYPGDSFAVPDGSVDTLLLPVAAPWMKISDALGYLRQVQPRLVIPTHDAILSEAGQGVVDKLAGDVADEFGLAYRRLPTGSSLKL